jgi:hypothetical protein
MRDTTLSSPISTMTGVSRNLTTAVVVYNRSEFNTANNIGVKVGDVQIVDSLMSDPALVDDTSNPSQIAVVVYYKIALPDINGKYPALTSDPNRVFCRNDQRIYLVTIEVNGDEMFRPLPDDGSKHRLCCLCSSFRVDSHDLVAGLDLRYW